MDILTDKKHKTYNRLSRYTIFPTYYNRLDDKYMYGTTSHLKTSTPYVVHIVKQNDTFDLLALNYYGNPTYFWIICDFNRIQDPFKKPKIGSKVKIPVMSSIDFKL